ncbi:MAG: diguanylate cyclase [Mariprofundales bacterium]
MKKATPKAELPQYQGFASDTPEPGATRMRVLIAEDDPVTLRVLDVMLRRWGYQTIPVSDGLQAWQVMQADPPPNIAILDWVMPGMDGLSICRQTRIEQQQILNYTYIIMLTARENKEDLVAGMEAGADDYVTKPFNLNELQVRIRAGKRIVQQQIELMSAREVLRRQATQDALTGLWNHNEILNILDRILVRRFKSQTAVPNINSKPNANPNENVADNGGVLLIMADLDNFKWVNDSYGHQTGDRILLETARRLRASMLPYDSVGRYGGEEFMIVLPLKRASDAPHVAKRLLHAVNSSTMRTLKAEISQTISMGCVLATNSVATDKLIGIADVALYAAKKEGRNRVTWGNIS